MKIHEYQAKNLFRKNGIPVLDGIACFSVKEAVEASIKLGGEIWAVKAQIHAGGRGKGGGVKIAKSLNDVKDHAEEILGMKLVTHQTDKNGQVVRRLFIEQGASIQKEFYVGMLVDRSSQRVCLMASSEGGMNIEDVANKTPEKINKILIDPIEGLTNKDIKKVSQIIDFPQCDLLEITTLLQNLYKLFNSTDASLVEINPLIMTTDNHFLALDAKMSFDDNSLFRHLEIEVLLVALYKPVIRFSIACKIIHDRSLTFNGEKITSSNKLIFSFLTKLFIIHSAKERFSHLLHPIILVRKTNPFFIFNTGFSPDNFVLA